MNPSHNPPDGDYHRESGSGPPQHGERAATTTLAPKPSAKRSLAVPRQRFFVIGLQPPNPHSRTRSRPKMSIVYPSLDCVVCTRIERQNCPLRRFKVSVALCELTVPHGGHSNYQAVHSAPLSLWSTANDRCAPLTKRSSVQQGAELRYESTVACATQQCRLRVTRTQQEEAASRLRLSRIQLLLITSDLAKPRGKSDYCRLEA